MFLMKFDMLPELSMNCTADLQVSVYWESPCGQLYSVTRTFKMANPYS